MAASPTNSPAANAEAATKPTKLHGRAFYESIGSPKYVVAPMVDQSEFAWRMLTRSFLPPAERSKILAYSPMLHARLFTDTEKYRRGHFEPTREHSCIGWSASTPPASHTTSTAAEAPYLDGNPAIDRPLIVQFCANDPAALLAAAERVAPYCDAVDLNLGCPQGIARRGNYGAFLQEDQDLVYRLVHTLHQHLSVPVTAKIRILATREETLAYARNVLRAGASILTVHGRRRDQKGHLTGVADWPTLRYLRESLPPDTVLFANGNVLQRGDLERCLAATGADAVMSAEGNLSDPAIFAPVPAPGDEGRAFWRGRDGTGGWRVDAVIRRYLDILWRYVLGVEPPVRRELFVVGEDEAGWLGEGKEEDEEAGVEQEGPARKKQKRAGGGRDKGKGRSKGEVLSPNFAATQAHLFHLLRHFVTRHTDVRDVLARTRSSDMAGYERLLAMVERKVAEGMLAYQRTDGRSIEQEWDEVEERQRQKAKAEAEKRAQQAGGADESAVHEPELDEDDPESSLRTVRACRRPWWVAQPIVRPLPKEAIAKGAVTLKVVKDNTREKEESLPGYGIESPATVARKLSPTLERPAMTAEIGSAA